MRNHGSGAGIQEVDPTFNAARVGLYPGPIVGSYAVSARTGNITLIAAGGALFTARWTSATHYALIRRVYAKWVMTTAFAANQEIGLEWIFGRSWSVSPSAGTAISTAGAFQAKRSSFPTSKFATGDMRIATAAAVTVGTVTPDGQALYSRNGFSNLTPHLEMERDWISNHFPLVLAQNDGILLRNTILMGAAGIAGVHIGIEWDEVLIADYP